MKRLLLLLPFFLLSIAAFPTAAQDTDTPLDWIPANFAGFVRVDTSDPQAALDDLNLALFVASVLQPPRLQITEQQTYDDILPMSTFDVENASFAQLVLPWLKDEVIIAYRSLDARFNAEAGNALMILPTDDSLTAASALSPVINEQDFPERETYRGMSIYVGDKTAFAFTPSAVLVGSLDLLHESLDLASGSDQASGQPLTADPVYQQVRAALPENGLVSAYVGGDDAARALSVLLSGSDAAEPFLSALDEALGSIDARMTPERLLLGNALDGIGVSLDFSSVRASNLEANVVLHSTGSPEASQAQLDPSLLDLIPRSAMIVQSGADARSAATEALYAIPFLSFAGDALAAFPVSPSQAAGAFPLPTSDDLKAAVSGFMGTIQPVVDIQKDILERLDGSYALVLLPRPNDPLPLLDAPFDVLLVVQTVSAADAQALQASASTLVEAFVAPLEDEQIGDQAFQTLRVPDSGEPLLRIGAVDNVLVIGTGSAAQLALDARRGDNRLTAQPRWQNLTNGGATPSTYVDVNAYYNTFLPTIGGPAVRPVSQLGLRSRYLGDNLFDLKVIVALSQ